jgi:hypothetical protein
MRTQAVREREREREREIVTQARKNVRKGGYLYNDIMNAFGFNV